MKYGSIRRKAIKQIRQAVIEVLEGRLVLAAHPTFLLSVDNSSLSGSFSLSDNSTDDTARINSAVNSAAGGLSTGATYSYYDKGDGTVKSASFSALDTFGGVYFPSGVFNVKSMDPDGPYAPITFASSLEYRGQHDTTTANGVTVERPLAIIKRDNLGADVRYRWSVTVNASGTSSAYTTITNLAFRGHGLHLSDNVGYVKVTKCRFDEMTISPTEASSAKMFKISPGVNNVHISRSVFENISALGAYGIEAPNGLGNDIYIGADSAATPVDTYGATADPDGNLFVNVWEGIHLVNGSSTATNVKVLHNDFRRVHRIGVEIQELSSGAFSGLEVAHNTAAAFDPFAQWAFSIVPGNSTSTLIHHNEVSNLIVAGTTPEMVGAIEIAGPGVRLEDNEVITAGRFYDLGGTGSPSVAAQVKRNRIWYVGTSASYEYNEGAGGTSQAGTGADANVEYGVAGSTLGSSLLTYTGEPVEVADDLMVGPTAATGGGTSFTVVSNSADTVSLEAGSDPKGVAIRVGANAGPFNSQLLCDGACEGP